MAVTSTMVPLGTPAPDFTLPAVDGRNVALREFAHAPALLVIFLCNHCPYVRHVEKNLGATLNEFDDTGLAVIGICCNDAAAYPDDSPDKLAEQAERAGWSFPYLVDVAQEVGRAYGAACTPDFFLYDAERRLAYRGAYDGSTPGNNVPLTGDLLRDAITRVLAGEPVPEPHKPSMGCSIKWRD
ncbi:MAG TPA: thioredoxin family protein [Jiangellaceae bacterium]|nr:thioredoxin family protein [Jiangellaceae bacterium]